MAVTIEEFGRFLARARIVDLSKKVSPGRAAGPLDTGKRKYEITSFLFPPGELMHNIEMESHISTHVEAPSHIIPTLHHRNAKDISEIAPEHFFGPAVLVDCSALSQGTPVGPDILETFPIRHGDIVLFGRCPHTGKDRCFIAREGARYLLDKHVKMIGFDDTVFPEDLRYPRSLENSVTHDLMLSNEIPIVEGLANMEELGKTRFLFFGLPAKMGGLESFPIRAIAIEDPA